MKTIPTLALLSFLALPALHAQSAEGFDSPGTAPAAPAADLKPAPAAAAAPAPAAAAPAPAPAQPAAAAFKKVPSRYAGTGPELAAYIASFDSRFGIRSRQTDVFGRYQDPNYAEKQPQQIVKSGPAKSFPKVVQTPFPDVVNAIEVNTLIPAKKQFLVGSRKFSVGAVLPIRLPTGGKTVKAQVMDVTAHAITFRNQETGETAIRKMASLPEGMQRGIGGISAPGMQSTSSNAPIEVQVAPPAPPMSSNQ